MAMIENGPGKLLQQFAETRSEEAFGHLVRSHAPMVFSTALRQLSGDRAAAEDVTQEVFLLLARKASGLTGVVLPGWLYRQTCRRASNFIRTETRRKQRETKAMEQLATSEPAMHSGELARELDAAMESLPAKDRDALVIRYFESADYSTVGRALGISEEAARKQVNRALERLSAIFKRMGITVASVSLGGTLSGFGAEPLPDGLASRVSTHALKGAPAATGSSWTFLLKPFLAGVAVTSLVSAAATSVKIDRNEKPSSTPSLTVAPRTKSLRKEVASTADGNSLESIISEIKRIHAGPSNALTALRLNVALDRIPNDQIASFISLANGRLNPLERAATYQRLLERWLDVDPEAAMSLVLVENVGKQVDPQNGTNLLINLFDKWLRKCSDASQAWLLKHWDNPVMKESAFRGTLRNHLATAIVDKLIDHEDKKPLRDFLDALPSDAERETAFGSITGDSPWGSLNRFGNVQTGLECYRFIKQMPDSAWSRDVARKFLSKWLETSPKEFEQAAATAVDDDSFIFALARLGARHIVSRERVPSLSGGYVSYSEVNDVEAREKQAMQVGLETGIKKSEVLDAIGGVLFNRLDNDGMLQWIDAHRSEIQFDSQLAEKAANEAYSGAMFGNVPAEIAAIRWAERVSNEELRASLCRSAFRKLCTEKPGDAAQWIDKPDMPQDLIESFRATLEETR